MLKAIVNSPVRSGDQTIVDGNLIIGTAGKGIDFSASSHAAGMTSELLADYEEGTWTPTIAFATPGDTSITYSQQNGKYTKIGRQVFFNVRVLTSAITWTTASGVLRVLGLPFTPNSTSPAFVPHTAILSLWTRAGYMHPVAATSPGDTTLYFRVGGSGVGQAYLVSTDFVSGVNMDIQINGSFFT